MWLRLMVSFLSLVVQLQWSEDIWHVSSVFTSESPARVSTKHIQRLSIVFGARGREALLRFFVSALQTTQESCDLVYARMPTQIHEDHTSPHVHLASLLSYE